MAKSEEERAKAAWEALEVGVGLDLGSVSRLCKQGSSRQGWEWRLAGMQERHRSAGGASLMDRKCVQWFPSYECQTRLQRQGRGKEYKTPTLYAEIILLIIAILSHNTLKVQH